MDNGKNGIIYACGSIGKITKYSYLISKINNIQTLIPLKILFFSEKNLEIEML